MSNQQEHTFAAKSSKLLGNAQEELSLDDFDRQLLAEPAAQLPWQFSHGIHAATNGRLSLPGHTAPFSPPNRFEPRRPRRKPPTRPSPHGHRSQRVRYLKTPPVQMDINSPATAPPSSPSFRIRKRQTANSSRSFALQAASAISNRFSSRDLSKNLRKRKSLTLETEELLPQTSFSPFSDFDPAQVQSRAPPIVQGIQLVSLNELPDRLRSVFRYPLFNAIQSKCFPIAYKTNNNIVVSAPTGGGKTAILEIAICRLVSGFTTDQLKIVYMAPTKSLCSERQRDWQPRFAALDLQCAELTGDTEQSQLRSVQSASIFITTPEKWDCITRKWRDHARLMQMVKLFLIDEVHILKDTRGATLEAVVSRMKSVGSNVRFVALGATVPNSEDIATWLGQDPINQHLPASRETFGEDFRPVKLRKHVIGLAYKGNDFGFEGACDTQLQDIIERYSHEKPIMVFCITRKSTINTAKLLARIWAGSGSRKRYWEGPLQRVDVQDLDLQDVLISGVAFHHAGLDVSDRHAIERGYLEGQINVICCTSTLAVGVNLPCHMVIIKNTMSWSDNGLKEYADLEIMQMLGRAGRPQFDTTAVAIIITKQEKATKYERLVSGQELLESCMHINLLDHLNAEIGLGTVNSLCTAKRWLGGTFLYVRLGQNPDHYNLDGDAKDSDLDDRIERICNRDLMLLKDSGLISSIDGKLQATELGTAMARYYVEFETMQLLLHLRPGAKLSDVLSAVVQASEFRDIRLKSSEKKLYKEINSAAGIKFPIKVDLAMHAHKRSLILQAELGGVEFPTDEQYAKHKRQFNQEKNMLFSHVHRLVHCLIDCQIHKRDALSVQHALEIARSFSARVWDNSPFQMKQIAQIGQVAVRKLAIGGIDSIEALEAAEPYRIEMLLSKNPPFGQKLHGNLKDFPKLRVSIKSVSKESGRDRSIVVKIMAECGFINDKVPVNFHRKPIYVCLLTKRSDGYLIDFKRIHAKTLNKGKDFLISAELLSHTQYITCSITCDTVAGTMRYAEYKPDLPAHLFPPKIRYQQIATVQTSSRGNECGRKEGTPHTSPTTLEDDEFGECEIDDQDMVDAAAGMEFSHIDNISTVVRGRKPESSLSGRNRLTSEKSWNPEKLDSGKWACNHKCKDKALCKHLCCREGVDKPPKPPKGAFTSAASLVDASLLSKGKDSTTSLSTTHVSPSKALAKARLAKIETLDLLSDSTSGKRTKHSSTELRSLQRLHENIVKRPAAQFMMKHASSIASAKCDQPRMPISRRDAPATDSPDRPTTDYDDEWIGGLPSPSVLLGEEHGANELLIRESTEQSPLPGSCFLLSTPPLARRQVEIGSPGKCDPSKFHHDDEGSDLEAAMIGLSDSLSMKEDLHPQFTIRESYGNSAERAGLPRKVGCAAGMAKCPTRHEPNASSKLFLSTDSPVKGMEMCAGAAECFNAETGNSSPSVPAAKRQGRCSQPDVALHPSAIVTNQAATQSPIIKAGQPAWVYDFDPAFIAEWQDLVDFV